MILLTSSARLTSSQIHNLLVNTAENNEDGEGEEKAFNKKTLGDSSYSIFIFLQIQRVVLKNVVQVESADGTHSRGKIPKALI
jgi:hypothetical protein